MKWGKVSRKFFQVLYYKFVLQVISIFLKGVKNMAQTQLKKKPETHADEHSSLKGTLASVAVLGFIIVITWVSVYFLFVGRL